jgi:ubiquinone/menaquinone biosynthesis C-methylase UbiE
VTDVWSDRAQAFRDSAVHKEGPDLDLLVEWCEPGEGMEALDVATGGGHVARRLREAGCSVVTVDPAPGMKPDVIARGEELPFADRSFDVVTCRIAPHHFDDVRAAVREMARVSRDRVVIEDNLFTSDAFEEAERLHDPTHVRCYTQEEWHAFFVEARLDIDASQIFERWQEVEKWFARVETPPADAERARRLLGERIVDGRVMFRSLVIRGRRRA